MEEVEKGISLISLIISIVIIIILAVITVPKIQERIQTANIAKQNTNIATIQEEIETYYNTHDAMLPAQKDESNNDKTYTIANNPTLFTETVRSGEASDMFYLVDMKKIGKIAGNTGEDVSDDDIYIVSSIKHNVYYVKGLRLKGITYHGGFTDAGTALTKLPEVTGDGSFDGLCNSPKLATGITAVKFNSTSGQWDALSPEEIKNVNHEWYDYRNGGPTPNKWANAKLADGSLLVWIPRYTYKIATNEHTNVVAGGMINIMYSNGINDQTANGYRVHPAFYWGGWNISGNSPMQKLPGGTELTGIWVGKFEASAANGLQDTSGDRISIAPNVTSWRTLKIGDMFDKCRQMQTTYFATYGIDSNSASIDPHMLKNSEWGAVAYLSKYALGNTEVTINENAGFLTGDGNYIAKTAQSATGNEYGIYDMNGGSHEHVASYLNNGHNYLNIYGASLVGANVKYKDIFPVARTDVQVDNYKLTSMAYGHALWETSNGNQEWGACWFRDICNYMEGQLPFMVRGGVYAGGDLAGLYNVDWSMGSAGSWTSWRVAIAVP